MIRLDALFIKFFASLGALFSSHPPCPKKIEARGLKG